MWGKLSVYWATSLASYLSKKSLLSLTVLKLYGYGPVVRMVHDGRNVLEPVVGHISKTKKSGLYNPFESHIPMT